MENLEALTHESILTFLIVLIALIWVAERLMSFAERVKKWHRPQEVREETLASRQEACKKKFDNDQKRLDEHDERLDDLEKGQRVLCNGIHALLEHALHNGNSTEMEKASKALFDHLNS